MNDRLWSISDVDKLNICQSAAWITVESLQIYIVLSPDIESVCG